MRTRVAAVLVVLSLSGLQAASTSSAQRLDAIHHAKVWTATDVAASHDRIAFPVAARIAHPSLDGPRQMRTPIQRDHPDRVAHLGQNRNIFGEERFQPF